MAATAADMNNDGTSPIGSTLLQLGGTVNRRWVEDKSAFGRRMLEKMGWKEGKGLGKNEDGDATFVKIDRRIDHEGVGKAAESLVGDSQFKKNLTNFNDVLKSLSKKAKVESKQAKKLRKKNAKKQKRRNQAPALTVDKRRVRSKNARAYSQHDLNQVLGIDSDPWAKGFHRVAADPSVLKARAPHDDATRAEEDSDSSSSSSSSSSSEDSSSEDSSSEDSSSEDSSSSDSESGAPPVAAAVKKSKGDDAKKKKQSKKRKQSQPEAPPPTKKTKAVKEKKNTTGASSKPKDNADQQQQQVEKKKKKGAKKSKKDKKKKKKAAK